MSRVLLWALVGALWLAGPARADPLATVAVDLGGIDAATFRAIDGLDLEQRVLVRLVQDGFATVAKQASPAITLVLGSAGTDVVVDEPTLGLGARIAGAGLSNDELHLAVAQQAAELARRAVHELAQRARDAAPAFVVFAGTAALYRPSAVDLRAEVGTGMHVARWFPHVALGVVPASVPGLHVYELDAQLGVAWGSRRSQRFTLQLAWRLGARLHHFDGDQPRLLERAGTRLDAVTTAGAIAGWNASPALCVRLELLGGITSVAYEHDLDGVRLWRRGLERAQLGLSLEWRP